MNRLHELLLILARPLSPLYSGLMLLRAWLYRQGILNSRRLTVPVVSIGNLTLGGTGKTPMVMAVVRLLLAMGRRPAVVSRGYHGQAKAEVNIVSNGHEILLDARQAGDEPYLLARSLPGVPIMTGVQRAEVARQAVARFGVDVIVLDDGFQHLALQRDIDLVLFKAPEFLGNAWVFPGGRLREPVTALGRTHGFILTDMHEGHGEDAGRFSRFLQSRFPGRPVFSTTYEPDGLTVEESSRKFLAFCGLADPESFRATLAREGLIVVDFIAFSDHYAYSAQDMVDLVGRARRSGADALITTEKDLVKVKELFCELPVLALRIRFDLGDNFKRFVTERLVRV